MTKIVKREIRDTKEEILLGVDYGEKNIGLAFGRNGNVSPLTIVSSKNMDTALEEISKTVLENKVSKIIIGLPLSYKNKETKQSHRIRRFSKLLKSQIKTPVEFVDEYSSSKEAVKEAISKGLSKKRRRKIDNIAAALILKRYYENKSTF